MQALTWLFKDTQSINSSGSLDLVFVIDETGSMSSAIAQVQRNVISISESVAKLCPNLNFGLVRFRDHPQSWEFIVKTVKLTPDINTIKSEVNSMTANGGGDTAEAVTDALYELVRMNWRSEAHKIAVLIGDAPPHGVGSPGDKFPQICPCNENWITQAESCKEMGIVIHSVCTSNDTQAIQSFKKISEITNGVHLPSGAINQLVKIITGFTEEIIDRFRIQQIVGNTVHEKLNFLKSIPTEHQRIRELEMILKKVEVKNFDKNSFSNENRAINRKDIERAIGDCKKKSLIDGSLFPSTEITEIPIVAGLYTKDFAEIPLTGVSIKAKILNSQCAEVEITQTFLNKENQPIEATYKFPIDENAAVIAFKAKIDEKVIEGKCMSKEKAQEKYDDAISKGSGAYLLEQDEKKSDLFQLSVGNLPPKKFAEIKISYITRLQNIDGNIRFTIPTTFAPTYSQERSKEESSITTSNGTPYSLDLQIEVDCTKIDTSKISSPSHSIETMQKDMITVVTLPKRVPLDSDFVLIAPINQSDSPITLGYRFDGKEIKSVAVDVEIAPLPITIPSVKEIGIVIDFSGSLGTIGRKLAIETTMHLLEFLNSKDTFKNIEFSLIVFGSTRRILSNLKRVSAARKFLESIEKEFSNSMGGSELLSTLKSVINGEQKHLLLITDGSVSDQLEILEMIAKESSKKTRVSTLGIGYAVNNLVRSIARAGSGFCETFIPGEKWESKVERLGLEIVYSISSPVVEFVPENEWKLKHKTKIPSVSNFRPGKFSALFYREIPIKDNEEIVIGTITLSKDGKDVSNPIKIFGRVENSEAATRTIQLVSKDVIRDLQDSEIWFKNKEKTQIIDIALSQNLTSKYTSFFAEETRDQAVTETMVQREVPTTLARTEEISSGVTKRAFSHSYSAPRSGRSLVLVESGSARSQSGGCCGNDYSSPPLRSQSEYIDRRPKEKMAPVMHNGKAEVVVSHSTFSETSSSTIGASFSQSNVRIGNKIAKAQFWDTAGQERYHSLAPMYYRGAALAIIVYDITDRNSFEESKRWIKELLRNSDATSILVGNKLDLESSRKVSYEEGKEYATSLGIHFFEISMKTLTNFSEFCMQMYTDLYVSSFGDNWKVVTLGAAGVGKSCIISQLQVAKVDLSLLAKEYPMSGPISPSSVAPAPAPAPPPSPSIASTIVGFFSSWLSRN